MEDVFCSEKIMQQVYYETDHMVVVYNKYPAVPGHSMVIPKRHVESPTELTAEEYVDMFRALNKTLPVLLDMYATDKSYDLIMQVGNYSGMTIHHIHMHITPRGKDDTYQVDTAQLYEEIKRRQMEGAGDMPLDVQEEVERLRKVFGYVPKSK